MEGASDSRASGRGPDCATSGESTGIDVDYSQEYGWVLGAQISGMDIGWDGFRALSTFLGWISGAITEAQTRVPDGL